MYCIVLYCMVSYRIVSYRMVWYGVICYGMVWYGMVWYGMVWYGMVWYGMVWYGMVWYGMVWYGMVWYGKLAEPLPVLGDNTTSQPIRRLFLYSPLCPTRYITIGKTDYLIHIRGFFLYSLLQSPKYHHYYPISKTSTGITKYPMHIPQGDIIIPKWAKVLSQILLGLGIKVVVLESCACLAQEQAPTVSFHRVIMKSITCVVHNRIQSQTIRTGKVNYV